jgi:hypothetical protein
LVGVKTYWNRWRYGMSDTPLKSNGKTTHAVLEREFIINYLGKRGYKPEDLYTLNPILRKDVLTRACQYASLKLAEIESCSRFINKLHTFG